MHQNYDAFNMMSTSSQIGIISQEGIISGNAALNDANIASISQEGIISHSWEMNASLVVVMKI